MDLQRAVRVIVVLSIALSDIDAVSQLSPRAYCSAPGQVICSADCSQVMLCMGNQEGGYDPQEMITCSLADGMKCSASQRMCVPAAESDCPDSGTPFTCNGVGSFPDPYDCKKFHVCLAVGATEETGSCDGTDEAYNPLTADCSLTTSDRVCTEGPVKACNYSLESGVVTENPTIYYICKPIEGGLYPEMYRCPGGQVYDVDLVSCVESTTASVRNYQRQAGRQAQHLPRSPKASSARTAS